MGFKKVAVLGYYYGGCIALEYTLRFLEHLGHLILLESVPNSDYWEEVKANAWGKGAAQEQLDALEASADNEEEFWHLLKLTEPLYFYTYDADLAERVLGKTIVNVEASEAGGAIQEGWDLIPRLSEISVPTLVLVGKDDFICPPSQAKIMHERIPNSELVIFVRPVKSGTFVTC